MMKTKKLFLLLAMLLMSLGTSAQSQLKGDVNNDGKVDDADITAIIEIMKNGGGATDSNDVNKDGKVDVADIVAIIGIMKNGGGSSGEAKYYWYVGNVEPTAATNPATEEGWTALDSKPKQIKIFKEDPNRNDVQWWYIAAPAEWGFEITYNGIKVGGWTKTTITINGVLYNVWRKSNASAEVINENITLANVLSYYWYAGPDMLTSETVPGTNVENECSYGWHYIRGNPTSIETGELGTSDCTPINWVLAVPTKFGLNHISNGEFDVTSAYDVTKVTCADGVEYIVFKQISASKKTDRIFVKGSTSNEEFDPNSYYIYIGLSRPTSDTDIATDLASNNTPLYGDTAPMGWRSIGDNISIYNSSNPAYRGTVSSNTVVLDKNFNDVLCYIAIPVGMGIYMDNGGIRECGYYSLDQAGVTIKGHKYNVYKATLEGEFTNWIYFPNKKYYCYIGNEMPTASTDPTTTEGWTELPFKPKEINVWKEAPNGNNVQWYIAAPAGWNFETTDNGSIVGGWTKTTVTIDGVPYNVWTQQTLANTANTTLANVKKTGKEEYDPNSYYIYIGLNRPTSDTDIAADLASNNTPLYEGYEAAGWRNVGQYPGYYSFSYPAFAGGGETVILDKDFNDVLTYIVLPKGMSIYDGLGGDVIGGLELDQENITIQGHQYNVYKGIFGGEFGLIIF